MASWRIMVHNISSSSQDRWSDDSPRSNKMVTMSTFFFSATMFFSTCNSSQSNRLRLFYKILYCKVLFLSPCQCYHFLGRECIIISEDGILKCVKCTRRNKPCVDMSWETIEKLKDYMREEFSVEKHYCDKFLKQLSVI